MDEVLTAGLFSTFSAIAVLLEQIGWRTAYWTIQ